MVITDENGSIECYYNGLLKSVLDIDYKGRMSVWNEEEGTSYLFNDEVDSKTYLIAVIARASEVLAGLSNIGR